jgi:hypothetical protein
MVSVARCCNKRIRQQPAPATAQNRYLTVACGYVAGICGLVGRATARGALCRGFDPCRRRFRDVAMEFGPKQSGWLINQLGNPSFGMASMEAPGRHQSGT